MSTVSEELESVFKIGAVSKITNIPVDTLRIWERRYSVVVPIRSKNADRLYQSSDINRLTLLKMLVDRGHSIGTVARLSNEELSQRLSKHENNGVAHINNTVNSINVVVIGEVLSVQIEHSQTSSKSFSFNKVYQNEIDFIKDDNNEPIDIIVLECPVIHDVHIDRINTLFKKSGAKHLMLIYGFTNSAARKLLDKTEHTYLQAPISVDNLRREVIDIVKEKNINNDIQEEIELKQKAPKRTYSNKQLIELTTASRIIKCECPQHLSSIVIRLVQFEHYIDECIERYDVDKKMHAELGNMAAHSRAILEQAITKVIESERVS